MQELQARFRELETKKGELKTTAQTRELNDEEMKLLRSINQEMDDNVRERQSIAADEAFNAAQPAAPKKDLNTQLREFLKGAKAGEKFTIPVQERAAMSTSDTVSYVQGITVVDLISTERPDEDILLTAGVPMPTGVRGNKIQWAFAGGVEAVFANELAQTTERKVSLDKQSPVQQRLTVRVRISNQSLENASYDLRSYIIRVVQDSIRQKINFAAASTTKATATFYGGFAQDAESGTYGQAGYTPGKQTGSYSSFSKDTAAEMISKLAERNISLNNTVFVMGAADFWALKVTPKDQGSGIMLIGDDNKLLGIPVIANNAINRASQKGAPSGHNIGLGNFAALPTMQHGDIRLSIDNSSAYAADTDEMIVTINADYSMTVLKDMADAFVVYSKQAETH